MLPTRADRAIVDAPFFPQVAYQCGPAALASVLSWSGREITPAQLVPRVYLPDRRGSLQAEIVAAARRSGRVAHKLDGRLARLLSEVEAGHPVLVLQNLAFAWSPRWHYAVVIGFDRARNRLILHSGTERRRLLAPRHFLRSWRLAGRWAVVVLPPERLPATATEPAVLATGFELDKLGRYRMAADLYGAAARRWPNSETPLLALANLHNRRDALAEAESALQRAMRRKPTATVLNNLAFILGRRGRLSEARVLAGRALQKDRLDAAVETLQQVEQAQRQGLDRLPAPAKP